VTIFFKKNICFGALLGAIFLHGCGGVREAPPISLSANQIMVYQGDTVYSLAHKYSVSPRALIKKNNLSSPFHLRVGQVLILPSLEEDKEAARSAEPQKNRENVENDMPALLSFGGNTTAAVSTTGGTEPLSTPGVIVDPSIAEEIEHERHFSQPPSSETPESNTFKTEKKTETPTKKYEDFPKNITSTRPLVWPVKGNSRTIKTFDAKKQKGISISAKLKTPVVAAKAGHVLYAGSEVADRGKLILVDHGDGLVTAYAHCFEILVKETKNMPAGSERQWVEQGEKIALVGKPKGEAPQLHFEVWQNTVCKNPEDFLPESLRKKASVSTGK